MSVRPPDLEAACMFFGLCVLSAFSVLFGVLLCFNCYSFCISFLSCSICSSFEVNVWLIFELLLDDIFAVPLLSFSCVLCF